MRRRSWPPSWLSNDQDRGATVDPSAHVHERAGASPTTSLEDQCTHGTPSRTFCYSKTHSSFQTHSLRLTGAVCCLSPLPNRPVTPCTAESRSILPSFSDMNLDPAPWGSPEPKDWRGCRAIELLSWPVDSEIKARIHPDLTSPRSTLQLPFSV